MPRSSLRPMSIAAFTKHLAHRIDMDVPRVESVQVIGDDRLNVTFGPSSAQSGNALEATIVYVGNFYRRYLEHPDDPDRALPEILAILQLAADPDVPHPIELPFDQVAQRLMVKLEQRMVAPPTGPSGVSHTFMQRPWRHLALRAVYDMPDGFLMLDDESPARWGVTEDLIFDTAIGNLNKLARATKPDWMHNPIGPNIAVVHEDHGYAASIGIFPEVIQSWFPGQREISVSFLRRDVLIAAPTVLETVQAFAGAMAIGLRQPVYMLDGPRRILQIRDGLYAD